MVLYHIPREMSAAAAGGSEQDLDDHLAQARAGFVRMARRVRDERLDDDALPGPYRAHRTRRVEERDVLLVVE